MALHEEITVDGQLHYPKGFAGAANNSYPVKKAAGSMEWFAREHLPVGITTADSTATPPTETTGAIYLIGNESGTLTVSAINWQSATTVRYTFSGTPNLSAHAANDYLIATGATDGDHNGTWIISAVNDGSDYIEVTNANITDATQDETTGATCTVTYVDWDGAPQNSWCKYNGTTWDFIVPSEGYLCYLTTDDDLFKFDGTDWVGTITNSGIYRGSDSLSGNTVVTQGANTLAFTASAVNAFSVDGTTFSVDALNGRVGLNTASPAVELDIIGSVNATGNISLSTGTNTIDFSGTSGTQKIDFGSNGGGIIQASHASGWISINGGNSLFDLSGTATNDLRISANAGGTAGNGVYLKAFNGTSMRDMVKLLNVGSGEPDLALCEVAGNVGVGTGSPSAKLQVVGGDFLVDSTSTTEFFLIDYSADRIGINNDISDPKGTVDIKGSDQLATSYSLQLQNSGNLSTMRVSNAFTVAMGSGHTFVSTIDAALHVKTLSGAVGILAEVSSASVDAQIKALQSFSNVKNALVTSENSTGSKLQLASYGAGYTVVTAFQDNQALIYTNDLLFNIGNVNKATLDSNGNFGLGSLTAFGTSSVGVFSQSVGTAPTTSPADVSQQYAIDHNGAGTTATHFRNEEGHIIKMIQSSAYTLNATAVLDRTLLASASATTLNNNNVLAALITDLKANGLLA